MSFAGGMHLHINTQAEQVSMAVWLSRGYEDRLCKLLVDMGVAEGEVSPMDMVGVLSCPHNSFGRHSAYFTPGHQVRLHPASFRSYGVACLEAPSI